MMTTACRFAALLACTISLQACVLDEPPDVGTSAREVALPAPTNLQVTVFSQTGVTLTWDPSPGATKYIIQRGFAPGTETTFNSVAAGVTTWSYNHLDVDTTYCWVVRNLNATREVSGPSNEVCVSTADAPVPAVPADVAATPAALTRIQVSWTGSDDADYYRIYAAPTPAAPVFLATVRHPTTTFLHGGVTPGPVYAYQIEAVNEAGRSDLSAVVTATTGVPANVTATASSASQITVRWDAVAGATAYEVFAAQSPDAPAQVATVAAPATSFEHTGLLANTTYGYQVRAVTPVGTSALSTPIVTATTSDSTCTPPTDGACHDAWCWVYPPPPEAPSDDVVRWTWGTSDCDIWVVRDEFQTDHSFRTVHWNGAAWTEVDFPFDAGYVLGGIWGSAPDDYWIVGGELSIEGGAGAMEFTLMHWDGASWTQVGPLGRSEEVQYFDYGSVWGSAANDVYAVAHDTPLYHYDGHEWTVVPDVPTGTRVFGSAADDVYVINGADLWHWDGCDWTVSTAPQALWSGWANSSTDVWLGGSLGNFHFDGTTFRLLESSGTSFPGMPLGTSTEMFTFTEREMTRWDGGVDGTPVRTPIFFDVQSGWRSPSGRIYAAGNGLLVH